MRSNPLRPLLPVLCLAALSADAGAQGTPSPGLRWSWTPPAHAPSIPRDVRFGGRDGLVWANTEVGQRASLLFESAGLGPHAPRFVDTRPDQGTGGIGIAAGRSPRRFFSFAQYPVGSSTDKRTELTCHDAVAAAGGAPFAPRWTHDAGLVGNNRALLASDLRARVAVLAVHGVQPNALQVDWVDGDTGVLLRRVQLPGSSLRQLQLSGNGTRLALTTPEALWILDSRGAVRHYEATPFPSTVLTVSGDGRMVAFGSSQALEVLVESGVNWLRRPRFDGQLHEYPVGAALSEDGSTVALAWWDVATGTDLRLEVFHHGVRKFHHEQSGSPAGLQNRPVAARLTADGRRAAFGVWGAGDLRPEVLLVDRDLGLALLELDLPGSVRGLDLDASGTRLVVAHKATHSNLLGTSGEVRLYETGELDIDLASPPRVGGSLSLVAGRRGAQRVLFLLGDVAQTGPLGVGRLRLLRSGLGVYPVVPNADGRARLDLHVPPDPALYGSRFGAQAAFRVGGTLQLSEHVVDSTFL